MIFYEIIAMIDQIFFCNIQNSFLSDIDQYQKKESRSWNPRDRSYDEFIRESLLFRKEDTDAGNAPKGRDKVTREEGRETVDV